MKSTNCARRLRVSPCRFQARATARLCVSACCCNLSAHLCGKSVRKVEVCTACAHVSLRNKWAYKHWHMCARAAMTEGSNPARADRIHLSIACHPSFSHIAHPSTLTRNRRCPVSGMSSLRAFSFSQVHAEAQLYSINCYLLCFSRACPPSALHSLHIIPLEVSFLRFLRGKYT